MQNAINHWLCHSLNNMQPMAMRSQGEARLSEERNFTIQPATFAQKLRLTAKHTAKWEDFPEHWVSVVLQFPKFPQKGENSGEVAIPKKWTVTATAVDTFDLPANTELQVRVLSTNKGAKSISTTLDIEALT